MPPKKKPKLISGQGLLTSFSRPTTPPVATEPAPPSIIEADASDGPEESETAAANDEDNPQPTPFGFT